MMLTSSRGFSPLSKTWWQAVCALLVVLLIITLVSYTFINSSVTCAHRAQACAPPYSNQSDTTKLTPCAFANCPVNYCPTFKDETLETQCLHAKNSFAFAVCMMGLIAIGVCVCYVIHTACLRKLSEEFILGILLFIIGLGSIGLTVFILYLLITNPEQSFSCLRKGGGVCHANDINNLGSACSVANCTINQCISVSGVDWDCYDKQSPYWIILIIIAFGSIGILIIPISLYLIKNSNITRRRDYQQITSN